MASPLFVRVDEDVPAPLDGAAKARGIALGL